MPYKYTSVYYLIEFATLFYHLFLILSTAFYEKLRLANVRKPRFSNFHQNGQAVLVFTILLSNGV